GDSGVRKTDWDVFMKDNPHIIKPGQKGTQWWIRGKAEEDIEHMAKLGLGMQRISFEWGRIEPEKGNINHDAIKRYKEIVGKIIEMEMIPLVTLNHYVLPEWVAKEGSWESRKTVGTYAHFVKF